MKTAVALVLQEDFVTSRNVFARIANGQSAAYQIRASEALRTTVENRGGRIQIEAVVTDLATQRNRQVIRVEGSASGGVVPPLNALAKRLNQTASDFSTKSDAALEAFAAAAQTANLQTRVQMLAQAIRLDSGFGLAYAALADTLAQAGQDPKAVLAAANAHRNSFTPVDRARFDLLAVRLTHAPLLKQEQAARAVLAIAPNQLDALSGLSSELFLSGDAASGQQLLTRALELSPGNPNLRQQLAIGLLETRRFADAEKAFLAIDNNPAVLPALAVCIFLEGDVNRADLVFNRYLASRAPNDPVTTLLRATWLAISGRTAQAVDTLESANFTDPPLRSLALSQIAIWQLAAGDSAAAKRSAESAVQLDRRSGSFAAIALLMARGDAPEAEWRNEVSGFGLNEQSRQTVLAYGLFLNRRYAQAAQVWQQIVAYSGGGDLRSQAMLASSLNRTGNRADAQKVRVAPFVPDFADLYAAISFSEMRRLLPLQVH